MTISPMINKLSAIFGMIPVSLLAWVILLPVMGTYDGSAQAQTVSAEKPGPAVTHNSWASGATMPVALKWPATGVIKNLIYVAGGVTNTAVLANNQVYDPATNTWSTAADMPVTTFDGASAVVKNILYVQIYQP